MSEQQTRGQFVQFPVSLIYGNPELTRDDKWVLLAIMGRCWEIGPYRLSYREIASLSGVPVSLLSSFTDKKTGKRHEGILDRIVRVTGYLQVVIGKSVDAVTGKPCKNAQSFIYVDYHRIWTDNLTFCTERKPKPKDTVEETDYQLVSNTNRLDTPPVQDTNEPVSYTNRVVSIVNRSVSYTNEPVSDLPVNVTPIDYIDHTDQIDHTDSLRTAFADTPHTRDFGLTEEECSPEPETDLEETAKQAVMPKTDRRAANETTYQQDIHSVDNGARNGTVQPESRLTADHRSLADHQCSAGVPDRTADRSDHNSDHLFQIAAPESSPPRSGDPVSDIGGHAASGEPRVHGAPGANANMIPPHPAKADTNPALPVVKPARKPKAPKVDPARIEAVFVCMEMTIRKLAGDPDFTYARSKVSTEAITDLLIASRVTEEDMRAVITDLYRRPKDERTGFEWKANLSVKAICRNYENTLLGIKAKRRPISVLAAARGERDEVPADFYAAWAAGGN